MENYKTAYLLYKLMKFFITEKINENLWGV